VTLESTQTEATPSLWSGWAEATDLQREHFNTRATHRAWSRLCSGCGQGDFLERKQKPTNDDAGLRGRGFPVLPEPALAEGARRRRFRTPAHRVHVCEPVAKLPVRGRR